MTHTQPSDDHAPASWLSSFRARAAIDMADGFRIPSLDPVLRLEGLAPRPLPRTIWIYWAQGWDACPPQSKLCLDSWCRHNADWNIVQLDDSTIATYVDLGRLLDGKDITVTGRSNHIRMHLLARYGGVWVDASTFCSRPLSDWLPALMQSGFFAFSRPGPDRVLSTWFLASEPQNHLVLQWRDLMHKYWEQVDRMDFYTWMHYLFAEGCRSDPRMNAMWHATPWISADGPHQVQFRADETSADDVIASIAERRVPVHKLQTRRPLMPDPDSRTPLACLLYGTA